MSQLLNSREKNAFERPKSIKRSSSLNLCRGYEVLKPSEVVKMMDEEIKKVQEVVNLQKSQIRQLLSKEKWDSSVFLEKFFDGRKARNEAATAELKFSQSSALSQGNGKENEAKLAAKRVICKRKLEEPNSGEPVKKSTRSTSENNSYCEKTKKSTCEVCLDSRSEVFVMDSCKHSFCKACIKQYLKTAIENSSSIDSIACAGHQCQCLLSDELVMKLLDKKMQAKYQRLICRSYVHNNRLIRWCISPYCHKAIKISELIVNSGVTCECGKEFCFKCAQNVHDLLPCHVVKDFNDVKAANLATATYFAQNTKQCPKCHVDIEKNGGCNHMTCRNCQFEFCWICFKSWGIHQICMAPEVNVQKTDGMRQLVDCTTKFATMTQSIELDKLMYKSQLQQQDLEIKDQWFKIDFVKQAVVILLQARRSLAESFIFTLFFENKKDNQWIRFELNQSKLQKATEDLSHVLETQVNADNFHHMKRQLTDAVNYCSGCHRAMFDHVIEGFHTGLWTAKK